MDPERWGVITRVFHEVLGQPREARGRALDAACRGDPSLRRAVQQLLDAHDEDPEFLEVPLARVGSLVWRDTGPGVSTEETLGAFRLVRPLGQGGMGEVFLATQETPEFSRSVAIKIVKRGMDGSDILRRFGVERQILATLRHPNIAQFYDAGTTDDGRPYFAMEFVDGRPIDTFARERQLSVKERLRLFQAVCSAVQHAHQNLIVHRDIKPGNVLVGDDGVPKLLDFGIGKVLAGSPSPGTSLTRSEARVLTPEYAAPEQFRGEPVTTATDVYALGVLLFQLLTGHRPFEEDAASYETLARAICERTSPRPSEAVVGPAEAPPAAGRLRRQLAGDVDNIILKALRKEPARRYGSAAALAEDVERHLTGRPVRARPDTLRYRTGKFLRRHRAAVAAATAVVLALVGTTVVTTAQSRRVVQERDKAREVQSFLLEAFGANAADEAPDSVTVRQLLDRRAATVDAAYAGQPELEAEMFAVLADAYERLGIYDRAEQLARRALTLRQQLFSGDHPDLASSLSILGWIRHQQGASSEAVSLLERATAMWRRLGPAYREQMSRALNDLGAVYDQLGREDDAEPALREALAIRLARLGPRNREVGITASNLAVLLYRRGRFAAADSLGTQALQALRASLGPDHARSLIAQGNLANFRIAAGNITGAEAMERDLLQRQERTQGRRQPRTAAAMVNYANLLRVERRPGEAEPLLREALSIQEETLGPNHRDVGNTLRVLGLVLSQERHFDQAASALRRAVAVNRHVYGPVHVQVAAATQALATEYATSGDTVAAVREHRRAIAVYEQAVGPDHPRTIDARIRLGALLLAAGRPHDALDDLAEAHRRAAARHPPEPTLVHGSLLRMAEAELRLGDRATADSLLRITEQALDSVPLSAALTARAHRLRATIDSAVPRR